MPSHSYVSYSVLHTSALTLTEGLPSNPGLHAEPLLCLISWLFCAQVGVVSQGVDLLGRDALLLSCLLSTLGSFADAVAATPQGD